jgi:Zn-dependent peptidase ImmA (M78 family)
VTAVRPAYTRVRRRVDELLRGLSRPPVDLEGIARQLGAEIRLFDLESDVSGVLYRDGDRRVVVVNAAHPEARRRFTIAHELGHLALHKGSAVHVDEGFQINFRDPRSATAENVEEVEANAFAANLLMPAAWLWADLDRETFDLGDDGMLERLAERYQVSKQAMVFRLASMRFE